MPNQLPPKYLQEDAPRHALAVHPDADADQRHGDGGGGQPLQHARHKACRRGAGATATRRSPGVRMTMAGPSGRTL